ncbi:MAG: ABC transporter permease [Bacillota bacterium]
MIRWVTASCIALSTALLFSILGIQGGLDRQIERAVEAAGGDNFRVVLTREAEQYQGRTLVGRQDQFPLEALAELEEGTPSANAVGAESVPRTTPTVKLDGKIVQQGLTFVGVTPNYFAVRNIPLSEGRVFTTRDASAERFVAIIGSGLLQQAQGRKSFALGSKLETPGGIFDVIGVMPTVDDPLANLSVFVPISTLAQVGSANFGPQGYRLWVQARSGLLEKAISEAQESLKSYQTGASRILVEPDHISQVVHIRFRENVASGLFVVVLLSLIITFINMTNALLYNVLARAKEHGVRKAIGASRTRIILEELMTAIKMVIGASASGVILGIVIRPLTERLLGEAVSVSIISVAGSLSVMAVGSIIAGYYPASRAAGQPPFALMRQVGPWRSGKSIPDARTLLAVIAVVTASFGLVMILNSNTSTRTTIQKYMEAVGESVVIVRSSDPFSVPLGQRLAALSPDLLGDIEKISYIKAGAYTETVLGTAEATLGRTDVQIAAVYGDLFSIRRFEAGDGRVLSTTDYGANVCVLGTKAARQLFGEADPVGKTVAVEGQRFQVVGVLRKRPESVLDMDGDRDEKIFIPFGSEKQLFSLWASASRRSQLTLKTISADTADAAIKEIKAFFARRFPGQAAPAVTKPLGELTLLMEAKNRLAHVFLLLGLIAGVIGTAGVANLLMIRVIERTRDIGIRQACGASRKAILIEYLRQSMVICAIGSGAGLASAELLSLHLFPGLSIGAAGLLLHVTTAAFLAASMGFVGGLYPALVAARNRPGGLMRQ